MPNISMPDLIALKSTVGSDDNVWGNKLNEITDSIQATLESIITDLNFVTGINSIWEVKAYATFNDFPLNGEPSVIYYAIDTQLSYQWDGLYIVVGLGNSSGVTSVNSRVGAILLTKSDVGLSNVDNTSDLNKVISTATQNALNNKQPLNSDLTAIANLSTDGMVIKTGSGTAETRSVEVSGKGLSVSNGNGVNGNPTITSNATETNTPSTIVARDASGNFNAGTISASLNGNANTADTLHTARTIGIMTGDVTSNGSTFNGGSNNSNGTTISNNVVSNPKLADMPTKTIKGNDTLITDDPKDLTVVEVQNMITDTTHRFVTDSQISQWNSTSSLVKSYETVATMQLDYANLPDGSVVETLGYTTVNDGLGRKYIITATDVNNLGITVGNYFASAFLDDNSSLVGEIKFVPFSTLPIGFLKANGAEVSRTTYARLFAAIGTTYGVGDGSTTFNLPDVRGYFPRFTDDGRGVDSGRVLGTLQSDAIRNITGYFGPVDDFTVSFDGSFYYHSAYNYDASSNTGGGGRRVGFDASRVVPTATENRPKNISFMGIIKY